MNFFMLDSSVLVKRYANETGTPLMNVLFSQVSPLRLICLLEGIGEVISVFVRKRNDDRISSTTFRQIMVDFNAEIIQNVDIEKLTPSRDQIIRSWALIETHAINSSDALLLCCALDENDTMHADGNNVVLVSSDWRLLKAAKAEDMITFNPETDSQAVLQSLIFGN
jgi:predicted nucleic acid-binding protein